MRLLNMLTPLRRRTVTISYGIQLMNRDGNLTAPTTIDYDFWLEHRQGKTEIEFDSFSKSN
jgi:hypothetical protein